VETLSATERYLIIAVVGNREGWTYGDIERFLGEYLSNYNHGQFIVISGGAGGVDFYAERYCRKHRIPFQKICPIENLDNKDRYLVRNDFIAKICDEMVVFNKKKIHSGSEYTANVAKNLLRKVTVISYA